MRMHQLKFRSLFLVLCLSFGSKCLYQVMRQLHGDSVVKGLNVWQHNLPYLEYLSPGALGCYHFDHMDYVVIAWGMVVYAVIHLSPHFLCFYLCRLFIFQIVFKF